MFTLPHNWGKPDKKPYNIPEPSYTPEQYPSDKKTEMIKDNKDLKEELKEKEMSNIYKSHLINKDDTKSKSKSSHDYVRDNIMSQLRHFDLDYY